MRWTSGLVCQQVAAENCIKGYREEYNSPSTSFITTFRETLQFTLSNCHYKWKSCSAFYKDIPRKVNCKLGFSFLWTEQSDFNSMKTLSILPDQTSHPFNSNCTSCEVSPQYINTRLWPRTRPCSYIGKVPFLFHSTSFPSHVSFHS